MRIVAISDTHGRYQPDLPDGDILIQEEYEWSDDQFESTTKFEWDE